MENECSDEGGLFARTPVSPWHRRVRELSDRLVDLQRPLRILDALNWDGHVERAFFAAGASRQPPVTPATYRRRPLDFDPGTKHGELKALHRQITATLGRGHPAGRLLLRRCAEYHLVVDLLAARGTPAFSAVSRRLYGAPGRACAEGPMFALLGECHAPRAPDAPPQHDAAAACGYLSRRLGDYFGAARPVHVRVDGAIAADATACHDTIKIRRDARFAAWELRLLEVHEGWVHLGTSLAGRRQPVCTFLGKTCPSATVTQEGLAVVTEILAGATHPDRLRQLARRVRGIARAEAGATFLDVYRGNLAEGCPPRDAYQQTMRIFRGSLPAGAGPFHKDLAYSRGFRDVARFLKAATPGGGVALLFCGKTSLHEVSDLARLRDEGLLAMPDQLPPPFVQARVAVA